MTYRREIRFVAFLFLTIIALLPFGAAAQSSGVDPTFNAMPSNPLPNDTNFQQIVQPDGKVIVYNAPSMFVNGELRSGMFRLNADGSTDTTFSYNNEAGVGISNVMVAPDGKIVLAGTTSPNHAKMVRLNSNGSIDNSFSVFFASSGSPGVTGASYALNAIQPDGKVIATLLHWGNIMGTWTAYSMARYNVDGSVDSSFTPPNLEGGHLVSTVVVIELLPDGRMYMAVSSGNHLGRSMSLSLRFSNGAQDPSFVPFTRSISGGFFINIEDMALTADGGVLAAGLFWPSMTGGPYNKNLYKFLPSGTVDPAFNPPSSYTGDGVHVLPDGKVLYMAALTSSSPKKIIRLAADGALDNTYVMDPAITSIKNVWRVDAAHRPIFLAQTTAAPRLVRLLDNGSIDPGFGPQMGVVGSGAYVAETAVQPDGKILVAGSFTGLNGVPRNRFARLNANGMVDTTFDPGSGFNVSPAQIVLQPDGKIIVCGNFTSYNGTALPSIARLNVDGSLDNTFSVTLSLLGAVESVALQPDGKIVIGGRFSTVNGVDRTGVARLESNGALDPTFDTVLATDGQPKVERVVLEPLGKITIGGTFTTVNGVNRANLARLTATGATDETFNASVGMVFRLWQQPDGKYISVSNGSQFLRHLNNGSVDPGFTPPAILNNGSSGTIQTVMFLPDGGMLIGGRFNSVGGVTRRNIARLSAGGTHIAGFLPDGANGDVYSLTVYPGGKTMVGGGFSSIATVTRYAIARLEASVFQVSTPFDFNGDGRADYAVYRPSSGVWYQLFSNGDPYGSPTFGLAGDVPVPADYDGDGKTDLAIFRPASGDWWYRTSSDGALRTVQLGGAGDVPLPADINADGTDDFVIFKPSNNTWYRLATTGSFDNKEFGLAGDKPVIGDFDGDGKTDQAIFRPSSGDWWYSASSAGGSFRSTHWGQNGDIPAPADFDGDGKTDLAVFRPSNGAWYILKSSDLSYIIQGFGLSGDRPAPADYDGDGRSDIAVFRPSTGVWYVIQSTAGTAGVQWGVGTDVAVPNAFVPH